MRHRQAYFDGQLDLDPVRSVFSDLTRLSTKIPGLWGVHYPATAAIRLSGADTGKTATFSGALRLRGMTAPIVLDQAMNGVAFEAY